MGPHGVCDLVRRAQGPQNKEQKSGRSRKAGRFNHIPNIPGLLRTKNREHPVRPRGVETGFSLEEWVRSEVEAGRILFCKQRESEGMKGVSV